ncbi:putative retrotransposon protein [Cucumis melo var. makuwa]|uniref:Putative retrotransposon protein n=1 Tax=Cucumis melo var. makuwa TaxID=1194695 RepID=A0A5D3C2P0_CUCMM|nr:putative retrotransposon protein [Cucumis melo var. makuwa]
MQKIREKSKQGPDAEFKLRADGAIVKQQRLCVPSINELNNVLLEEAHRSAYAMHLESIKMPGGLLNPLPVPEWKWEHITMDFQFGSPRTSSGHDSVWVIVDKLTKTARFIPIKVTSTPDNQSDRTLQTLEYMLKEFVLQFKGSWDTHLSLMEFAYDNTTTSLVSAWYHLRLCMADHVELLCARTKWESKS